MIHGPKTEPYDIDIGPVMLSDWYHKDYFSIVNDTMNGLVPLSNNVLINGKMNYPCENTTFVCTPNAGISKFAFKSGKKHLLRLINPSAEAIMKFTIDGHNLKVIANDFVPIDPYETNVVTLGVGQRSDVIVSRFPSVDVCSVEYLVSVENLNQVDEFLANCFLTLPGVLAVLRPMPRIKWPHYQGWKSTLTIS